MGISAHRFGVESVRTLCVAGSFYLVVDSVILWHLLQSDALPFGIPPGSGIKVRLIFCCCIQLSAVENKVTTANFVSEVIKHLSAIIGNVCNHRTKCQCLQIIASPKASVTYGCYFGESDAFKYITNIEFIFYNFRNISIN